jgi:hypothetical protein
VARILERSLAQGDKRNQEALQEQHVKLQENPYYRGYQSASNQPLNYNRGYQVASNPSSYYNNQQPQNVYQQPKVYQPQNTYQQPRSQPQNAYRRPQNNYRQQQNVNPQSSARYVRYTG